MPLTKVTPMPELARFTPPDKTPALSFTSPAKVSPAELLRDSDHRPFALPQRPWVMAQTWQRLLFVHYPVPVDMLRPLIPQALTIDTYDGQAWVGIVPFLMTGVRLRGLPPMPFTATFPELNVRSYVRHGGKAGVWFFSLDAANPLAVTVARALFNLPYFHAEMSIGTQGDTTHYHSTRRHLHAPTAFYDATYTPTASPQAYADDSLERWLTERYALYAQTPQGNIVIGHITHQPWELQPADLHIERDTLAQAAGITLPDTAPLLHYAHHLDILAWAVQPVSTSCS